MKAYDITKLTAELKSNNVQFKGKGKGLDTCYSANRQLDPRCS